MLILAYVGVTSVRVADRLTIFLICHLAHLQYLYWLADYHTYIFVDLLLFSCLLQHSIIIFASEAYTSIFLHVWDILVLIGGYM